MSGRIVGIDLGTTNSEVAAMTPAGVVVLEEGGTGILPSVVGLDPENRLLVGQPAWNQLVLYPERTIRSVKRLMGTAEKLTLGDRLLRPQEVSALILGALRERAERLLDEPVEGAVITVPAWFTDAQRHATREAGEIAGLTVHRIVNEPTAASLAYAGGEEGGRIFLVYDLGGGTFDVSVVRMEGGVHEVLASHGDTRLGGDDLDELVYENVLSRLDPGLAKAAREDPRIRARLLRASEEVRRRLSAAPYAKLREEAVATVGGVPRHAEVEISREEFETWTRPVFERTLRSVHAALDAAKLTTRDVAGVLLVGGVTRTPLVHRLLEEATGRPPRTELHPDLCVALGAGLLASRLSGEDTGRVLVDITPYSFGPSHSDVIDGALVHDRYHPVIRRGTPLPASAESCYYTMYDSQDVVEVHVYQGESPNALENIEIGNFLIEDLADVPAGNQILCRLDLDLSGILEVRATERATGLSKSIRIEGALGRMGARELATARERFVQLTGRTAPAAGAAPEGPPREVPKGIPAEAKAALERYLALRDRLHEEDRAEGDALVEMIATAGRGKGSKKTIREAVAELSDLMFYAGEGEA
ncbi:MAG: Hsp70 family protein [Planctomycetes bacterium]|nr:Hsp70 family protein [Planctomycetota bacterium]